MTKYTIIIKGNDIFEKWEEIEACGIVHANAIAHNILSALQKTTIEQLRVAAIAEYNIQIF